LYLSWRTTFLPAAAAAGRTVPVKVTAFPTTTWVRFALMPTIHLLPAWAAVGGNATRAAEAARETMAGE
jgi:hypothetical protein